MKNLLIILSLAGILFSCAEKKSFWESQSPYTLKKGVNISHWLSQSDKRGMDRDSFFTEKDVAFIASCGYDHIRLPIDEEQMWNEKGEKIDTAFRLLHNAIAWCDHYKLRVLVDLHIVRAHHFLMEAPPLWTDPQEQEKFLGLWKQLSEELKQYPVQQVGYEIMNEAVAKDPEDWNKLIASSMAVIRAQEPTRTVVIGSNKWQQVHTFDVLKVPANDTNIILSFHFYEPFQFTHYTASWTDLAPYTGPVKYPGITVEASDIKDVPEKTAEALKWGNRVFTKETMDSLLAKPLHLADSLKLPLYCGEFGCLPSVDRSMRLAWYADLTDVLEKHDIGWANWDYKGGFGIVDRRSAQPDSALIQVLIK